MIRWASPQDHDALGRIMFDAIHGGDSPYTADQRRAWLPAPNAGASWSGRLSAQRVAVAEAEGTPVGFMTLRGDGCIDLAFLLPAHRGKGLFRALFKIIEIEARAQDMDQIWTNASLMAEGPFQAAGFVTERIDYVARGNQTLTRYRMHKWLI